MGEGKVGELVAPEWADTHRFKGNKNKFLELLEKSQSHVKTLD
jgi:hypothetical protein